MVFFLTILALQGNLLSTENGDYLCIKKYKSAAVAVKPANFVGKLRTLLS